jgi:hypothetical protein
MYGVGIVPVRVMIVTMVKQLNLMDENGGLRAVINEDDLDMLLYLATKYHRYMAGSIKKLLQATTPGPLYSPTIPEISRVGGLLEDSSQTCANIRPR